MSVGHESQPLAVTMRPNLGNRNGRAIRTHNQQRFQGKYVGTRVSGRSTGREKRTSSLPTPRSCAASWSTPLASARPADAAAASSDWLSTEIPGSSHPRDGRLITLDDALTALEQVNPRGARIVEYRYFGGLTVEQTAAALGVSLETVTRDWRLARGWLLAQMRSDA
ncbi:MAG: hypothetical protein JO217_04395 [Acidobacteriaceae bacterium]|nr:hypothetical protein [Acidobacteriaceae bacterium]